MSDNVNHPKHYENGPFECIELSRLLSSDWGQVVQYCFRWQHKNGVEDLIHFQSTRQGGTPWQRT